MTQAEQDKYERFAQLVATGMDATNAHRRVYASKGTTSETSGCKLKKKLTERIAEIRKGVERHLAAIGEVEAAKAETALIPLFLSQERSLSLLAGIALTPIGEIDEKSPLCQSVKYKVAPGKQGREGYQLLEYRMPDKIRAIELHAKLMGWLESEGKQTFNVSVAVVTEEKRKTIMERRRAALEIKDAG